MITKEQLERLVILGVHHNIIVFDACDDSGDFTNRMTLLMKNVIKLNCSILESFEKLIVPYDSIVWPDYLEKNNIEVEYLSKELTEIMDNKFKEENGTHAFHKHNLAIACDKDYRDCLLGSF